MLWLLVKLVKLSEAQEPRLIIYTTTCRNTGSSATNRIITCQSEQVSTLRSNPRFLSTKQQYRTTISSPDQTGLELQSDSTRKLTVWLKRSFSWKIHQHHIHRVLFFYFCFYIFIFFFSFSWINHYFSFPDTSQTAWISLHINTRNINT